MLLLRLSQGLLLCLGLGLLYATYYHFEHVHFHVNRFYANLGYKEAQHNLGHSFMHGKPPRPATCRSTVSLQVWAPIITPSRLSIG